MSEPLNQISDADRIAQLQSQIGEMQGQISRLTGLVEAARRSRDGAANAKEELESALIATRQENENLKKAILEGAAKSTKREMPPPPAGGMPPPPKRTRTKAPKP